MTAATAQLNKYADKKDGAENAEFAEFVKAETNDNMVITAAMTKHGSMMQAAVDEKA